MVPLPRKWYVLYIYLVVSPKKKETWWHPVGQRLPRVPNIRKEVSVIHLPYSFSKNEKAGWRPGGQRLPHGPATRKVVSIVQLPGCFSKNEEAFWQRIGQRLSHGPTARKVGSVIYLPCSSLKTKKHAGALLVRGFLMVPLSGKW